MGTEFSEIYELFLSSIDDYELSQVEDTELEQVLGNYLMNCFSHLQSGVRDLSDLNKKDKRFNYEASIVEQGLIAKAMKLEWVASKKHSQELMEKSIGDRDYKAVQGTEYLKELTRVERDLKAEIDRGLIDYSFSDLEFFGGLA